MTALAKFDTKTRANKGVEIELKDIITGKGADAFITVVGEDSDVFQDAATDMRRALTDLMQGSNQPSAKQRNDLTCTMLAACTVGWRNLETKDGSSLSFSREAAFRLYDDYPAIREQINQAIANRSNFVLA